MAIVEYDSRAAAAFVAGRHLPDDGLRDWRSRIAHYLRPAATTRILDLGAGTGHWSAAFRRWYGAEVVAVEPSEAMRAAAGPEVLAGHAADIPLPDAAVDAVWLSTVVHHIPDLTEAATEIRRVLRPGGLVLIRSAFAGRPDGIELFRYFKEATRVLDARFPSAATVAASFGTAGFTTIALESVPQLTAPSLGALLPTFTRSAHTPLMLLADEEYETGLSRLHAADPTAPVIDRLDLLVLRAGQGDVAGWSSRSSRRAPGRPTP